MADPQAPSGAHEGWVVVDEAKTPNPASQGPQIGPSIKGTALPPTRAGEMINADPLRGAISPEARSKLNEPLANTGIGMIDSLTTPANLLATGIMGVAGATEVGAGNALAKARAAIASVGASAAPQIKYEIIKSTLQAAHVPMPIAMGLAMVMSGKKGVAEKPAAPSESVPASPQNVIPPAIERYMPNVSAQAAPVAVPEAAPVVATKQASAPKQIDPAAALAAKFGTPSDIEMAKQLIARGVSPSEAARQASGGNPKRFAKIMSTFMQTGGAK